MPSHEPIWDQLNSKKIGDNAGTVIQAQSNPVHLEYNNKGTLEDINLVNRATMRDGSPIPKTCQVKSVALTDNSRTPVFTPNEGEVWQLIAGSSIADQSPAQTTSYYMYYQCNDQDGTAKLVYVGSVSSTSSEVSFEDLFEKKTAQIIDENTQVQLKVNAMGSATSYDIKLYATRLR